jgi:tartrate dehydrogenase/decarboxylase/D-malate dehydrogenase
VVPEALRVLDAVTRRFGIRFEYESFPWGCDYYLDGGQMMPEDGLETLSKFDSILLGAVGAPGVADHISLWGLLIPIRREFQQYVNLRPVCLLEGVTSPLRDKRPEDIDFFVVRENNEGEYSNVGGRIYEGTESEAAFQESIFTRAGVTKVMKFAFELARRRPKKRLTSATKSNGIIHTMPFWDEIFREVSIEYTEVEANQYLIDALCARLTLAPEQFDVIVASNLFGDILSDLGPALAGSLGIAPSANLNPEKEFPSMFEPVHGSAPDIAGRGIANPIGQIWSAAMMLEHLGHTEAAAAVEWAFRKVIAEGETVTPDLGGNATTKALGKSTAENVLRFDGTVI